MTENIRDVRRIAQNEGLDYAFRQYSSFEDVEDEDFHDLRMAYVEAADALANYIGYDSEDEEEDY